MHSLSFYYQRVICLVHINLCIYGLVRGLVLLECDQLRYLWIESI